MQNKFFLTIVCLYSLLTLFFSYQWPTSYDEAIGIFEIAGTTSLEESETVQKASEVQSLANNPLSFSKIAQIMNEHDVHPPLYFWGLALWQKIIGPDISGVRLFSWFLGIGSLVVFASILKAAPIHVQKLALVLLALSSVFVIQSANARVYICGLFLFLCSILATLKILIKLKTVKIFSFDFLLLSLASIACCWTNHLATMVIAALLFYLLINSLLVNRKLAAAFIFFVSLLSFSAIFVFSEQLGSRPHQFSGFPGFFRQAGYIVILIPSLLFDFVSLYPITIIFCWSILLYGFVFKLRPDRKKQSEYFHLYNLALLSFLTPIIAVVMMAFLFEKDFYFSRYLFYSLPGLVLLIAIHLQKILESKTLFRTCTVFVLLGFLTLSHMMREKVLPDQGDYNAKRISAAVSKQKSKDTLLLIGTGYGLGFPASVVMHLEPDQEILLLSNNSKTPQLISLLASRESVYLLRAPDKQTQKIEKEVSEILTKEGYSQQLLSKTDGLELFRLAGSVSR